MTTHDESNRLILAIGSELSKIKKTKELKQTESDLELKTSIEHYINGRRQK